MSSRWIPPSWSLTTLPRTEKGERNMKKAIHFILKLVGKLALVGLIAFVVTFAIYMTNAENKLIYYVVRPLLNKHYDAQVRDRKI